MAGRKNKFSELASGLFRRLNIRIWILCAILVVISGGLISRLFTLQIVNGEEYLDNFQLKIRRKLPVAATRGNIYDRNGNILAYNELAYSVVIRDTYADTNKDKNLNHTVSRVIDMIEKNGDTLTLDFDIEVSGSGDYAYTVDGTALLRFLADIYGHSTIDELKYEEKTRTAAEVIQDLAERYQIGSSRKDGNGKTVFEAGSGYTDDPRKLLQMCAIRYELSLNSFQRYLATTLSTDVKDSTVAEIEESADELQGVSIEEDTVRRYIDGQYFSHIIGYTGKVSTSELEELKKKNPEYTANDIVGKAGIEKTMESNLQGTKGSETAYVDNLGNLIEVTDRTNSIAGNDVYLTIDKDLQETATDILERHLAQIILSRIRDVREYDAGAGSSSSIIIPIYDVYYAVIGNSIADISHFDAADASDTEKQVQSAFEAYQSSVWDQLKSEVMEKRTPYKDLDKEYENYESYIVQYLYDHEVLRKDQIDTADQTYQDWTVNETISMSDWIEYCIAKNWIDVSKLDLTEKYSDSSTVFSAVYDYIAKNLKNDSGFVRKEYKYLLLSDGITGNQICQILLDQGIVTLSSAEEAQWESGSESAYTFMINRITNLDLTPAQLALDPHSGSMVITDVNTGDVLAMVSYPSYDNNKMSNGVDAAYFKQLQNDLSSPLLNYSTQQRTAPGSTFKMVTATAGLNEGVITSDTIITCTGTFTKIGEPYPHCWVYPGSHGRLNVIGGIKNSCNDFFYEVGYRLGLKGDTYDSDKGVAKLKKYADEYGLTDTSGVEIEEYAPKVSDQDAVRSAIGQGNSGYTTAQLARYVTTVANSGTCYNLTLIDKINDTSGTLIEDNKAAVRNTITMPQEYWNDLHEGMKEVVESKSYYEDLGITVAGKTGTAQESTSRPNHALFVCYAPYDQPKIAIACRIANGYASDYAAQTVRDVIAYYFGLESRDEILTGGKGVTSVTVGD